MNKKFIIIALYNLHFKQFDIKEDWMHAIGVLRKQDKQIIALKWSEEANEYVQQQIEE